MAFLTVVLVLPRYVGVQGFAAHLVDDAAHLAKVHSLFEQNGPEGPAWLQQWTGVQVHHLTLEVTAQL